LRTLVPRLTGPRGRMLRRAASLTMKPVEKPGAGYPHVQFDELRTEAAGTSFADCDDAIAHRLLRRRSSLNRGGLGGLLLGARRGKHDRGTYHPLRSMSEPSLPHRFTHQRADRRRIATPSYAHQGA
jgi:hypothetical protein